MTTHPHAHAHAPQPTPWNFTAAIAAWLLPGLGHYLLGQHRRGGILAATIGVLWLAGLVIGGIGTFDRSQMAISIVQYGQYGLGPSIVLHYAHRHMRASGDADGNPRYEPAFGRVQEQAVLYTALAGMLNLLAVMDVMYRDPRKPHPIVDGHLHPDPPHPHHPHHPKSPTHPSTPSHACGWVSRHSAVSWLVLVLVPRTRHRQRRSTAGGERLRVRSTSTSTREQRVPLEYLPTPHTP